MSINLRFYTGDGLPPIVQGYVTSQQAGDETTALHISDDSVHRVMDDSAVSYDTYRLTGKIADEIATGGADQ